MCLHARLLTAPGKEIIIIDPSSVGLDKAITGNGTATVIDNGNGSVNSSVSHDKDPSVTSAEITLACTSDDVDLRLAALTLLTASQRTR